MGKSRRSCLVVSIGLFCLVLLSAFIVLSIPDLRWRAEVAGLKLRGRLSDLSWSELAQMLRPGSPYYLKPILKNANPYSAIRNPYTSDAAVEAGARIFRSQCASCHGSNHENAAGPNLALNEFQHGSSDWALFRVITRGVPGTAMQGKKMDAKDVWHVIAYIHTLSAQAPSSSKRSPKVISNTIDKNYSTATTFSDLLDANNETNNWLMYSGSYDSKRHSILSEMNINTAHTIQLKWVYQGNSKEIHSQTTPIVVNDVMYFTESPNKVIAVDARTGRSLWTRKRDLPEKISLCCGPHTQGLAILEDKLYWGTLDAHLIAMHASNGEILWDVQVADSTSGFSIKAAPLALNNKIITGVAGGEFGIRGFLDAYNAATGKRIWRFHTIPGPGEPGHDSWSQDAWKTGGGATWMIGSFDPDLNLVYWGVGNPAPVFNGDVRQGDNLYSNSIIALNADSGQLQWHFQFTPHDEHDWDANQVPVLVDIKAEGKLQKLLLTANKNGFGYVLDRTTGELRLAYEIAKQTWALEISAQGRPVKKSNMSPSTKGTLVYPSVAGAANWWPPSYSPLTNLFYIPVLERASIYFKNPVALKEGELFLGSGGQSVSSQPHYTVLRAFVAGTNQLQWEFKLPPRRDWAVMGGALSTAGNLVFFGDKNFFFALDARTGEELWRINLGSAIYAAPITYLSEGRQQLTIAAGRSLFTFALPQ